MLATRILDDVPGARDSYIKDDAEIRLSTITDPTLRGDISSITTENQRSSDRWPCYRCRGRDDVNFESGRRRCPHFFPGHRTILSTLQVFQNRHHNIMVNHSVAQAAHLSDFNFVT